MACPAASLQVAVGSLLSSLAAHLTSGSVCHLAMCRIRAARPTPTGPGTSQSLSPSPTTTARWRTRPSYAYGGYTGDASSAQIRDPTSYQVGSQPHWLRHGHPRRHGCKTRRSGHNRHPCPLHELPAAGSRLRQGVRLDILPLQRQPLRLRLHRRRQQHTLLTAAAAAAGASSHARRATAARAAGAPRTTTGPVHAIPSQRQAGPFAAAQALAAAQAT